MLRSCKLSVISSFGPGEFDGGNGCSICAGFGNGCSIGGGCCPAFSSCGDVLTNPFFDNRAKVAKLSGYVFRRPSGDLYHAIPFFASLIFDLLLKSLCGAKFFLIWLVNLMAIMAKT